MNEVNLHTQLETVSVHLHAKDITEEFHGLSTVTNLKNKMKGSSFRHGDLF